MNTMQPKGVEKDPSATAIGVTAARAVANMEFCDNGFGPDDLAVYFLPHHRISKPILKTKLGRKKVKGKMPPGLYEYIIARTLFFDKLFADSLKRKIPQIILLGAGYDSRPYRFSGLNQGTRIFEMDIATTQRRKLHCLQKAGLDVPPSVTFLPINFQKEPIVDVLQTAGYDPDREAFFLWEGVSYYLDSAAVKATLEMVRSCSHIQSLIAFDYSVPIPKEKMDKYYGARELKNFLSNGYRNEPIKFSIAQEQLNHFLSGSGLKITSHWSHREIEDQFLTGENGTLIGPIPAVFRFVIASPAKES